MIDHVAINDINMLPRQVDVNKVIDFRSLIILIIIMILFKKVCTVDSVVKLTWLLHCSKMFYLGTCVRSIANRYNRYKLSPPPAKSVIQITLSTCH